MSADAAAVAPGADTPRVQQLAEASITLVPLEQLQAMAASEVEQCTQLQAQADSIRATAEDKLAEAGAALVESPAAWSGSQQDSDLIRTAAGLVQQLRADDTRLGELETSRPTGFKHLFEPLTQSGRERTRLGVDRAQVSGNLRGILLQLVQQAPPTTTPQADGLRGEAAALVHDAAALDASIAAKQHALVGRNAEIAQRQAAITQLGFDSLLTLASLEAYGPKPVESPLVLKKGEQAYLSWPAALARHVTKTTYVGASQGMSFPIAHTGIRYRVGSFRGHPIAQDVITRVDSGTLVLTNQRIAYIGTAKSVTTPLAKILHVEVYTDGLGVFQEGKESPNIYLIGPVNQFMMYINFLLNLAAGS